MLACADIEEGIVLRAPACACRYSCSARSASATWTAFSARPHADDLDAVGRTRAPGRRRHARRVLQCHLKIDTGMNRLGFRHDNLAAHAARSCRQLATCRSTRSTRTSQPPTTRSTRVRSAARAIRGCAAARCTSLGIAPRARHAAKARRCCATSASGTTSSGRVSCCTESFRRRWPPRFRCGLPCRSTVVSCM